MVQTTRCSPRLHKLLHIFRYVVRIENIHHADHCAGFLVKPMVTSNSGGARCLSGFVLDSRPRGCGFVLHWRHLNVSLNKTIYPLLRSGTTQEDRSQRD